MDNLKLHTPDFIEANIAKLAELFPMYKQDEIDLLAKITTKKELDQYIRDHGRDTK